MAMIMGQRDKSKKVVGTIERMRKEGYPTSPFPAEMSERAKEEELAGAEGAEGRKMLVESPDMEKKKKRARMLKKMYDAKRQKEDERVSPPVMTTGGGY